MRPASRFHFSQNKIIFFFPPADIGLSPTPGYFVYTKTQHYVNYPNAFKRNGAGSANHAQDAVKNSG